MILGPGRGEGFVVKLCGVPWSCSFEDVQNFLSHCTIRGGKEGRIDDIFVELGSEDDVKMALKKERGSMGHQYTEVFKSHRTEMDWMLKHSCPKSADNANDGFVWLQGLLFGCTKEKIIQFFSGLEIMPIWITLPMDLEGKITGEAFVQFTSQELAEKALGDRKERIGHRYIEVFKSSWEEVRSYSDPPLKFMSMQARRYIGIVKQTSRPEEGEIWCLLWGCYTENDIYSFFSSLNPVRVHTGIGPDGRVISEFAIHEEDMAAISKHRANKQQSYMELFLNSTTGASNEAYSSHIARSIAAIYQGMGVPTQSTYGGLEIQSVRGCYETGYGGRTAWLDMTIGFTSAVP
uniref:RRM domain-containing protein n=2 Tax=Sus scrofa TaxID=9823 RepID=A0A8D1ABG6_PIG